MNNSFNMRGDSPETVRDMQLRVKKIREQRLKTKVLSQLLAGKTVDITQSSAIFEAINKERMEFDEIMKLHPDQTQDCLEQAKEDRELGKSSISKAKWSIMGHIPPCIFYSRPAEYWKDKNIIKEFFRLYPKFRVNK